MLRYKGNNTTSTFASYNEMDNAVTRNVITSKGYGRKRICVKYLNSTTSYGLTTDTTASEYSPVFKYNNSYYHFGSLLPSNTSTSLLGATVPIDDYDIETVITSMSTSIGFYLNRNNDVYYGNGFTFNLSGKFTHAIQSETFYISNFSIVNTYDPTVNTVTKREYNSAAYNKLDNLTIDTHAILRCLNPTLTSSEVNNESFLISTYTNSGSRITNYDSFPNIKSATSFSVSSGQWYAYTTFVTVSFTDNNYTSIVSIKKNKSTVAFLPDDYLPLKAIVQPKAYTTTFYRTNTAYNFDYTIETQLYTSYSAGGYYKSIQSFLVTNSTNRNSTVEGEYIDDLYTDKSATSSFTSGYFNDILYYLYTNQSVVYKESDNISSFKTTDLFNKSVFITTKYGYPANSFSLISVIDCDAYNRLNTIEFSRYTGDKRYICVPIDNYRNYGNLNYAYNSFIGDFSSTNGGTISCYKTTYDGDETTSSHEWTETSFSSYGYSTIYRYYASKTVYRVTRSLNSTSSFTNGITSSTFTESGSTSSIETDYVYDMRSVSNINQYNINV